MGRGKALSVAEKSKIDVLQEEGYSGRNIGTKIGRSCNVVNSYLKDKENYGGRMKGKTFRATTERENRLIIKEASNAAISAVKIANRVGCSASISTVRRVIKKCPYLRRRKMIKKPLLNAKHRERRLIFAKEVMSWSEKWRKVIFTDEKKFNFDGPDGFNYYFHDLRKEERVLSKRHSKIGGVMIWGAISYYGTIELQFIKGTMKAESYKTILENARPKIDTIFGPMQWLFQQDNAPVHTARIIKSWFHAEHIEVLTWPPYSPDLNIIENVWGWMARKVYEGGRQFEDQDSLIAAIKDVWKELSLNYLKSLYDSIPNRIFEVILNNGGNTHY